MEKNNRGTTGAVRSNGRGQPMALLLIRCFAPLETGLQQSAPNDTASRISILYIWTRPRAADSIGRRWATRNQPPGGETFSSWPKVCLSLGAVNFGAWPGNCVRRSGSNLSQHGPTALVQPRGTSNSAACRSLLVFWVEVALPPPVIDVNPPAGKISQTTRRVGETAEHLPCVQASCSDVYLDTPPECKTQSGWSLAWWR